MKEIDGVECLLIVLAAPATAADGSTLYGIYEDSRALYQWVEESFQRYDLATVEQAVTQLSVAAGAGDGQVDAVPEASLSMLLPKGVQVETSLTTETLTAPLTKGTAVGSATYTLDGEELATVKLVAGMDVERDNLKMVLLWLQHNWPLFGFLLLAVADVGGILILLKKKGTRAK